VGIKSTTSYGKIHWTGVNLERSSLESIETKPGSQMKRGEEKVLRVVVAAMNLLKPTRNYINGTDRYGR
jgi:hypothetical protein